MTRGTMRHCQETSTTLRRLYLWSLMTEKINLRKQDLRRRLQVFMIEVRNGTFSALNVSFENLNKIFQLTAYDAVVD